MDGASGTHVTKMDTSEGQPSPVSVMRLEGGASEIHIIPDETKLSEVRRHYEQLVETKQSDPQFSIWDFGGQVSGF